MPVLGALSQPVLKEGIIYEAIFKYSEETEAQREVTWPVSLRDQITKHCFGLNSWKKQVEAHSPHSILLSFFLKYSLVFQKYLFKFLAALGQSWGTRDLRSSLQHENS